MLKYNLDKSFRRTLYRQKGQLLSCCRNRGSASGIRMGRSSSPGSVKNFHFTKSGSGAHSDVYPMCTANSFIGGKADGA
jgi:hypothetical protein